MQMAMTVRHNDLEQSESDDHTMEVVDKGNESRRCLCMPREVLANASKPCETSF